ncbi:MAG: hypothetical protein GPOALKHO_000054 [Sodalis sp.]|nr:MAG: hypothetical protein GPOALKHO_000054 [Sodalis sp.]
MKLISVLLGVINSDDATRRLGALSERRVRLPAFT